MGGKLYIIGIGPGDPELMTLKAVRILNEVPCIIVPKGREEGTSLALSIVRKALDLDTKDIVEAYFPMVKTVRSAESGVRNEEKQELNDKWNGVIDAVLQRIDRGRVDDGECRTLVDAGGRRDGSGDLVGGGGEVALDRLQQQARP